MIAPNEQEPLLGRDPNNTALGFLDFDPRSSYAILDEIIRLARHSSRQVRRVDNGQTRMENEAARTDVFGHISSSIFVIINDHASRAFGDRVCEQVRTGAGFPAPSMLDFGISDSAIEWLRLP